MTGHESPVGHLRLHNWSEQPTYSPVIAMKRITLYSCSSLSIILSCSLFHHYPKYCVCASLTGRVDSRFRSKPRVFISTLVSGSDSRRNNCSVPKHRTISPFTFWSAWNAMFLTHRHTQTHTLNHWVTVWICCNVILIYNNILYVFQRKSAKSSRSSVHVCHPDLLWIKLWWENSKWS